VNAFQEIFKLRGMVIDRNYRVMRDFIREHVYLVVKEEKIRMGSRER
jgi:hypothetical protein